MPRRTSSPIRSVAPGPPSSNTARSQAASSRDTSAPAAATTPPSFERNSRSRVTSRTRLAIERRDLHDALHRRRAAPEQVQQTWSRLHDQDGVARGWVDETFERKEQRSSALVGERHAIAPPMPCRLHLLPAPLHLPRRTFHEYVVIHLIDTRRKLLSGPVEDRIKRLALVAAEVFFRGPIVRLESVKVGTPLEVMTQLVGERFPGFLAPVEVAQPGKARERAVVEDDPRVEIGPAAAPLERHALTQGVDLAVHRMWEGLGADVHRHHPACEFRWDLALQSRDERSELIQPHNPTPVRNRRPPFHSAFRTPHSALTLQALRDVFGQLVGGEANLFQRVPVAHRHG